MKTTNSHLIEEDPQAHSNFYEITTEETRKIGDFFNMTDKTTICINSFGREFFQKQFATQKFVDNQVVMIHRLED